MHRRNWPNLLIGASVGPTAVLIGLVLLNLLIVDSPRINLDGPLCVLGVALYVLSSALLLLGVGLTIRWRDRYTTKSVTGPVLFVVSVLLLITTPALLLILPYLVR